MSNAKLNKLKSGMKISLNLSSNVIGDSTDETNFSQKLLSTDTKVLGLRKVFAC